MQLPRNLQLQSGLRTICIFLCWQLPRRCKHFHLQWPPHFSDKWYRKRLEAKTQTYGEHNAAAVLSPAQRAVTSGRESSLTALPSVADGASMNGDLCTPVDLSGSLSVLDLPRVMKRKWPRAASKLGRFQDAKIGSQNYLLSEPPDGFVPDPVIHDLIPPSVSREIGLIFNQLIPEIFGETTSSLTLSESETYSS